MGGLRNGLYTSETEMIDGLRGQATGVVVLLDGKIAGLPGDFLGWGFTVEADPSLWISFVTSFTIDETNPSVGIYSDFIGNEGGPTNFELAPGAPDWTQSFDAISQTGLGVFSIDPNALMGSRDSGKIRVLYDAFAQDPNVCDGCTGALGQFDVPFQVTVGAPEPSAWLLAGLGLAALWRFRRRGRIAPRTSPF